jgi:hypothetical protein
MAIKDEDFTPRSPNVVQNEIRKLLKSYFWLPNLSSNTVYRRLHDDHDGTREGSLHVLFSEDGDAWILTTGLDSLRFRMPMIGGGASQHTRTALMILAEAIRLDNEEAPIEQTERPRPMEERRYCLVFADHDKPTEHFAGFGAEEAARKRYRQAKMSCACKLYRSIDDDKLNEIDI